MTGISVVEQAALPVVFWGLAAGQAVLLGVRQRLVLRYCFGMGVTRHARQTVSQLESGVAPAGAGMLE